MHGAGSYYCHTEQHLMTTSRPVMLVICYLLIRESKNRKAKIHSAFISASSQASAAILGVSALPDHECANSVPAWS